MEFVDNEDDDNEDDDDDDDNEFLIITIIVNSRVRTYQPSRVIIAGKN